jgi:hypothetical protein
MRPRKDRSRDRIVRDFETRLRRLRRFELRDQRVLSDGHSADQSAKAAASRIQLQSARDVLAVECQGELVQLRSCGRSDFNQRVAAADQIGARRQRSDPQPRGRFEFDQRVAGAET